MPESTPSITKRYYTETDILGNITLYQNATGKSIYFQGDDAIKFRDKLGANTDTDQQDLMMSEYFSTMSESSYSTSAVNDPTHVHCIPDSQNRLDVDLGGREEPLEIIINYNRTLHRIILVPLNGKLNIVVDS